MAVLIVASLAMSVMFTASQPSWSYYGLHTRAWELGLGALVAALAPQVGRIPARIRAVGGWLGLAAVLYSALTYGGVSFPGYAAALPVLGAVALLVSGPTNPGSPAAMLGWRPLVYVGTRSYSLYLWHWPAIILAEAHLERQINVVESVCIAAGVFVVAEVGYRLIENPIRSSPTLVRRRAVSLSMGAGLVVAGLLAGLGVASYRPDLTTGVFADAPDALGTTTTSTDPTATSNTAVAATTTSTIPDPMPPPRIDTSTAEPLAAVVEALTIDVLPDNLRPSLGNAQRDRPILYENGCHRFQKRDVLDRCVFGDPDGTTTIAIWGDSHMVQWYNALEQIAITHGWRIVAVTQGGCPFLDILTYNDGAKGDLPNCKPWREEARQYMRDNGVDVVLIGQSYGLLNSGRHNRITSDQWREQLPAVIESLRADGIEPILVGDSADPKEVVPNCLSTHRGSVSACEARDDDEHTVAVIAAIKEVTDRLAVSVIDPTRLLCSEHRCPAVIGDILVYRDGHHITTTLALWMTPVLEQMIVPFVDDLVAYRAFVAGEALPATDTPASTPEAPKISPPSTSG